LQVVVQEEEHRLMAVVAEVEVEALELVHLYLSLLVQNTQLQ
jgi:hypothetical protein